MSSPAGATASPVASQHKIGSFRFKSSSDSLRITELLEQNVAAVDKVLVQYNILFPKHSSPFFSDFEIPQQKIYFSVLIILICMTLQRTSRYSGGPPRTAADARAVRGGWPAADCICQPRVPGPRPPVCERRNAGRLRALASCWRASTDE